MLVLMIAVIVGATGLIGNELLQLCLADPSIKKVICYSRRDLVSQHPKLVQIKGELSELLNHQEVLRGDIYFCCLGTTIKVAGSQEAFQKVDHSAVVDFAKIAKHFAAKKYLVVSALGADAKSSIFYNRVKGQMEEDLKQMDLKGLTIFRPSLLLGNRKEFRLGESIFKWTQHLPLWVGRVRKYKPVEASAVAAKMLELSMSPVSECLIFESDQI